MPERSEGYSSTNIYKGTYQGSTMAGFELQKQQLNR
jgi:hypothetical protein